MITVKDIYAAAKEATSSQGYIYFTVNSKEDTVEVWVNSARPSTFCSMNRVLLWTTPEDVRFNQIFDRQENQMISVEEAAKRVNQRAFD